MDLAYIIEPDPSMVLSKALIRAAEYLDLSQKDLAMIVGTSAATLSRIAAEQRGIDPSSKEGELTLLLIRLFRSLDALVGGDRQAAQAFMNAYNDHLGGVPKERILSVEGLVNVTIYLDAMRGRF